ncbi:TetR/AcrR family transcriptional regulator [Burkholderia territorii]|uniref:TetR/AcrR family transcriptional regulator n=1 Tax=Burkholderia territorii TaxID=1503055 RepID=UPI000755F343|nr:TetR/AcrR family transcriptional regulator [Burkholderia territorii]KVQ65668.1 TetR family transcriptional regulator [Burkholderia territorii]
MEPNLPIISRIHRAAFELFAQKGETQVSISELAQAAGIARGTVYNHVPSPEALFETVAAQMAEEMHKRVVASFVGISDPAQRLANGIRYFIRRAHEEPHWGRFLSRFAFSDDTLQGLWTGATMRDVVAGLEQQRYNFRPEQLHSAMAVIAGSALASIVLVLDGHRTWRDAGSDTAELVLRSLGVDNETARRHATAELPPLAELP